MTDTPTTSSPPAPAINPFVVPPTAPATNAPWPAVPTGEPAIDEQDAKTPLSRRSILMATEQCLLAEGYDKTTIRRIAKELNCAVGSIYRYFKDKRELLSAVTERRFEAVVEHTELGTPLERIATLYCRTAAERPELYRLMFWLASVGQDHPQQAVPGVIHRIILGWSHRLGEDKAWRFWSRLHGAAMLGLPLEQALGSASPAPAAPAPRQATTIPGAMPPAMAGKADKPDDLTLL